MLRFIEHSLNSYFQIPARGSTIATELRAGSASFFTMSYLLFVNPQILAKCGVSHDNAVLATALSSAASSAIAGLGGNLPFGLAPGIGLSAYFAYGLVATTNELVTLEDCWSMCFISGLVLGLLVLTGITNWIMTVVPSSVKLGLVVGMGLLIAMIGLCSVDLVVGNEDTLVQMGDLNTLPVQLCMAGLVLVGTLAHWQVPGGILMSILGLTLASWHVLDEYPTRFVDLPEWHLDKGNVNLLILWDASKAHVVYPAIATFVCICIFDMSGVMFGLSTLANLMEETTGSAAPNVPNAQWGFYGSVAGTLIAAAIGSTPIICTVECAAGIKEGGRTGLTAVVISLYFLLSIFLAPVLGAVPAEATAPILIVVGCMMMSESGKIKWDRMSEAIPAFLTVIMMPLTYSITNGILFGLVLSGAFYITTGQFITDLKAKMGNTCEKQTGEKSTLLDSPPPFDLTISSSVNETATIESEPILWYLSNV